jgi:hypothetical protein
MLAGVARSRGHAHPVELRQGAGLAGARLRHVEGRELEVRRRADRAECSGRGDFWTIRGQEVGPDQSPPAAKLMQAENDTIPMSDTALEGLCQVSRWGRSGRLASRSLGGSRADDPGICGPFVGHGTIGAASGHGFSQLRGCFHVASDTFCKPDGYAYGGSNPSLATPPETPP